MKKFMKLVVMALILGVCAGALPITAHAAENTLSVEEYKGLELFLHQFHFSWGDRIYDSRSISTQEKNILQSLIGDAIAYAGPVSGGNRDSETNWFGKDPLGKWNAYHKTNALQIDWVLANVFNCSQTDISKLRDSLASSNQGEYYLDGYYYSSANGIGDDMAAAAITDAAPYEDYLCVTYELRELEDYGGELRGRFFAVVQKKAIGGTGTSYWSLYYHKELADGETPNIPASGSTPAPPSADKFTDVEPSDYFCNAVRWGVEQRIVSGSSASTFSPSATCTKAEILTFLWRAGGSPEPTRTNPFCDVSSDKYYCKPAVWAYEKGLVNTDAFDADTPCTRAMTVTYLWKLAGSPSADGNSFSDVPHTAEYAAAVLWAVNKGITSGTGGTSFSPDAVCTRAQIITFIYRNAGYETAAPPNLKPSSAAGEAEWKRAYLDYINGQEHIINQFTGLPEEVYKLVDINGDSIPELYIGTGMVAAGDAICTYYNGSINCLYVDNYGLSYIEGGSLLMDSGGRMDVYYDTIYTLVDGEFIELQSGRYGAEDNSRVQFDADGLPIYKYYWSGAQVSSEEEYKRLLNSIFDEQKATDPYDGAEFDSSAGRYVGNGLCDLEEIAEAIANY